MPGPEPIFCCEAAACSYTGNNKPHQDPYRERHYALYQSFIAFAQRRHRGWSLLKLIQGANIRTTALSPPNAAPSSQLNLPQAMLTPEALKNNPITLDTPYIIHLTTRHDFGPAISHRYFVCPSDLEHDWAEATLPQWFAEGGGLQPGRPEVGFQVPSRLAVPPAGPEAESGLEGYAVSYTAAWFLMYWRVSSVQALARWS